MSESVVLPLCAFCSRLDQLGPGARCEAYPQGIPRTILRNVEDHRRPIEGDGGLFFQQRQGMIYPPPALTDYLDSLNPPD